MTAIYAALRQQPPGRPQLIVTHSEASIKLIAEWREDMTAPDADAVTETCCASLSTQNRASKRRWNTSTCTAIRGQGVAQGDRLKKIEGKKKKIWSEKLRHDANGQRSRRFVAGAATKIHVHHRNWAHSPMEGVDQAYFTYSDESQAEAVRDVHFMDMAPHSWIKQHTHRREFCASRLPAKSARSRYLALMHMVDKKRSFTAGNCRNCKSQKTYVTLAKLRLHASHETTGELTR